MTNKPPRWEPDDNFMGMFMEDSYILKHRKPIRCHSLKKIARFQFGRHGYNNVKVRKTHINDVLVSTVFLTYDHKYYNEVIPVLFESMIFGGALDTECERCSTWRDALYMHKRMILKARYGAF